MKPANEEREPEDAQSTRQLLDEFLEKPGVMESLVCALTALAYVSTLAFGFVYDDKPVIVDNTSIRSWGSLSHYFVPHLSSIAAAPGAGTFYRPIGLLWLRLNYVCFGLNPAGWHFAMLAGHVLTTYLVFAVVNKLTAHRATAAIAALLFGLHPVHTENVAWLSSACDLLMSAFLIASFLAYLTFRERAKPILWMAISLLLFALALLSKETAAVFPLLIFGFAITSGLTITSHSAAAATPAKSKFDKPGLSSALKQASISIPYFIVLAAYLAFRLPLLHGLASPLTPLPWTTMFYTWPSVLWFDLKHLLLPLSSSEFYSLAYVTSPSFAAFILPALALAVALIAASYGISKLSNPGLGFFALLWTYIPILPTLYLRAVASDNFVHDRFLYLPSFGIVLLIALVIEQLSFPREPRSTVGFDESSAIKWSTVAILATAAFAATISYQFQWANNILLYSSGVKSAPQNLIVKDNLANALSDSGHYESAIPLYLSVLQQNPGFWSSNYNLGYAYYRLGKFADAEAYLTRAIRIDDRDPDEFILLARAQMQQGELLPASQSAEQALQRGPLNPGFHFVHAKILEARGLRNLALAEYQAEVIDHPENAVARSELQRAESSQ
ncbi:MAG: tetratricopeptide repeat protein [Terriglobales bacterium]